MKNDDVKCIPIDRRWLDATMTNWARMLHSRCNAAAALRARNGVFFDRHADSKGQQRGAIATRKNISARCADTEKGVQRCVKMGRLVRVM